ncbi:GNAT family N-acetyltransferase [Chryseobacterium kwangjuense]|uniref:N-acetyltransferase domain-containing protein n=1 Tax=Chryseobacterium kwangjuense TaxID=267125 RepID=A0A135WLR6_9FLAO|nr:GNAT family N-acetyltransferase [Chryseobacterium kwangjuense]KXH85858.1 hypothetical protein AU378_08995 [Chryseobacterium kwangjuense]
MEIRNLKNISVEELLSVFNESFSDYIVPFHLTSEQLKSKISAEKIDLDLSVGAFQSEKLVGFILRAEKEVNNQQIIYNAGTGVIREYKGQGLVRKMYDHILHSLNRKDANILTLEVIVGNDPAIRAYENLGFKTVRKLLCFNGIINIEEKQSDILLVEIENFEWDLFQSFWEIEPSWQSSKEVLEGIRKDCMILGAYMEGRLVGYTIYNPVIRKVYQIAVDKKYRRQGIGSQLLNRIGKDCKGQAVSFNNVDDSSASTALFLESTAGLKNWLSQFEMKKNIEY